VWRDGPAGPRPAVVGGPDVWEVVAANRAMGNRPERTARHLGLDPAAIEAALAEYRSRPDEIDARIREELSRAARAEAGGKA